MLARTSPPAGGRWQTTGEGHGSKARHDGERNLTRRSEGSAGSLKVLRKPWSDFLLLVLRADRKTKNLKIDCVAAGLGGTWRVPRGTSEGTRGTLQGSAASLVGMGL